MSVNKKSPHYSEFGKKKGKKVLEGAGFLLNLLRSANSAENDDNPTTSILQDNSNIDVNALAPEGHNEQFDEQEIVQEISAEESCNFLNNNEKVGQNVTEKEDEIMEELPAPSYVNYDFTGGSIEVLCEYKEFQNNGKNNFLKGCKWSPDGCTLLTNSDDRVIRAFTLPDEFYESKFRKEDSDWEPSLKPICKIPNGDLVYDFCWYPFVSYPNTHCTLVAVTSRDHPVHLWDVQANILVATFRSMNHVDELTSAHSLAFSSDGRKLYAGFKNTVRIFDFFRPGQQIDTKDTRGNKRLMNGQNGIISCIATCPTDNGLFVCGSYHKTLSLYADNLKDPQCVLHGHTAGITHVCYHSNGYYVYSGTRKNGELFCWDLRNLGSILHRFQRHVDTNQRIHFDIDKNCKFLMSGNTNGDITIYNLENSELVKSISTGNRCVNGVSFNPFLPLLASSSGQRLFENGLLLEEDDINANLHIINNNRHSSSDSTENCIKIWHVK